MALNINSQFFRTHLAHLRTDEEKATYWLDQWWGHGKNWSQTADLMGTTNHTAKSVINQIIEKNPEFYQDWLERLEEGAKNFMDQSLGKTMYTYYMNEIRVCDREYKNTEDPKDKREWKKMKHQLMSKVMDVHLEVTKQPKGGRYESYPDNLDSKISRAASSVQ